MNRRIIFVEDEKDFTEVVRRLQATVDKKLFGDTELLILQSLAMLKHVLETSEALMIILDLTLPDSSNEHTMEVLAREHHLWPPVFVLTGDERLETRDKCLSYGAVGFAIKRQVLESPNFFFSYLYNEHVKRLMQTHGQAA